MSEPIRTEHEERYGVFDNYKEIKECLRCSKKFLSDSKFNRVCYRCKKINEEVPEELATYE